MCGFSASSLPLRSFRSAVRGPDGTALRNRPGLHCAHHLLHMTGDLSPQPIVDSDLCALFNGEIYNWRDLGDFASDTDCILPLYREHGLDFARHLDGEFAIVILAPDAIVTATDPFATKPLHVSFAAGGWSVASYASDLHAPGERIPGNRVRRYTPGGRLLQERPVVEWDLRQFRANTDRWCAAFEDAIAKRVHPLQFLGLSSGYDSGAIACELTRQKAPFTAFSVTNNEADEVLRERFRRIRRVEAFAMTDAEFALWTDRLQAAEDFRYRDRFKDYDYKTDPATIGLAAICHRANQRGLRAYLSGQGSDEILSDYGFGGKKHFSHSEFGGLFPQEQRLWHSFADGTQIQYLNKEEYVAGHFGIEARHPFLDRQLVQEFLWLTPDTKNRHYKSPLHDYLTAHDWPFEAGKKRGFSCAA